MFIGREKELKKLEKLYNSNKFEIVIIYGKRHVGKSYLIQEFTQDKPTIHFTAVDNNFKINLTYLSRFIFRFTEKS